MTKTETTAAQRLAAALEAHHKAKTVYRPEDNPFAGHDVKSLTNAGLMKAGDREPARNMAPSTGMGHDMEAARLEAHKEDKADKSAKRMAQARMRAARKVEFDNIAQSPVVPSGERMTKAWTIVALLLPTITKITEGKRRWAGRFLGDVMDDVAGAVMENMALMLAKSDRDLDVLLIAAGEIGEERERTGMVPGEQLTDDERKERKAIRKGRKFLMQVVNNRVMDTLIDVYFRGHNLKWENIDLIATVMANINGVGEDPISSSFKASRAPAFLGTKFQRPDGIDSGLLATAINAAITEKGLDRMVELILNEDNRRADGSFKWTELAEEVFLASPHGDGVWMWMVVCESTQGRNRDGQVWDVDRARKARGDAARKYLRSEFEWLPGFIMDAVEAFDPQFAGWSSTNMGRATLASAFESYLPDAPAKRQMLSPVLRYADSAEAAQALIDNMAQIVTGQDLVNSLVSA